MIRHNLYFFIVISTVLVDASVIRQAKTDEICGRISGVLCVNDTLTAIINTAAKIIVPTAKDIEEVIFTGSNTDGKYHNLVEKKIAMMQSYLPTASYHLDFLEKSNIDQKFLSHLLKEAHNALTFFNTFINELFELEKEFEYEENPRLKKIQYHLINDMICPYRDVLTVYALRWETNDQMDPIQLQRHPELAQSTVKNMYLLVFAKLIREWMSRIDFVIVNLNKFH